MKAQKRSTIRSGKRFYVKGLKSKIESRNFGKIDAEVP